MALIMFIVFVGILLMGMPIAFALGISSLVYLIAENIPLTIVAQKMFAGIDSFTLLCIPGFVLAGNLMNTGGVTKRIVKFCNMAVGHIHGGLAMMNVLDSMIFAGISGTAIADVTSLGAMMIPAMVNEGYDDDFSVAITASTSIMGPIIPPSVPMVIAGTMTGLSVTKMFAGGVVPGVLLGIVMGIYTYYISKKRNYPCYPRQHLKDILITLKESIWSICMPLILLVGILGGFFTPTEAAAVVVVYAVVVGMALYRELKLKDIWPIVFDSIRSAAALIILVGIANVFAWILTAEQIPQMVANSILSLTSNKFLVILIINLILLFTGMFMESIAAIVIMFPVLLPIALSVGMDPIQFAVMAILNLMIGLITPPVGLCLFVSANIGKVPITRAVKANMPFLICSLIVLAMVSFIPEIVLLPVSWFVK